MKKWRETLKRNNNKACELNVVQFTLPANDVFMFILWQKRKVLRNKTKKKNDNNVETKFTHETVFSV
jgi:hypothetical protein